MLGHWLRKKLGGGSAAKTGGVSVFDEAAERARRILDDLHTLEINTIQNDAMTARRMPPLPTAVAEIADVYTSWMIKTLREAPNDDYNAKDRQSQFKRLRDGAANIMHSSALAPEEQVIARRIYRNSIALKTLCKDACANEAAKPYFAGMSLDDLYGTPDSVLEAAWRPALDDRAEVRKIWEVQTEFVLMQSMIQLEGDVVTRFSPLTADKSNAQVIEIHQQAIRTSTQMWAVMMEAVGSLAKALSVVIGGQQRNP